MRVLRIVVAMLAVPMLAAVAQGRRADKAETRTCTADQAAAVERARAAGRQTPPGLSHCAAPTPEVPPSGPHSAVGVVYNDANGDGVQDIFAGEWGLQGVTVRLSTATGVFYAETTTDDTGWYEIPNVGNTAWTLCVMPVGTFTVTQSMSGTTCVTFTVTGTIGSWYQHNFGLLIQ